MQTFVHLWIIFHLYTALQNRRSMSSNSPVFHSFGGISSKPEALLFLIFVRTTLSSSWLNCPSLTSGWWLIIFVIGFSVTLGEFLSRFFKHSFPVCIRSSWLAAFSLALAMLFFLLTSLTVSHAIQDCLSSNEFFLLIRPLMHSICSFLCTLISWVPS